MQYCHNPNCQQPVNPFGVEFCQSCGEKIKWLQDRYNIIQLLGRGEFSQTYLATDTQDRFGDCTIKQLIPTRKMQYSPEIFQTAKDTFKERARQLSQLPSHPQIGRVIDYFEEGNNLYLVREYIPGKNLKEEIENTGNFNEVKIWQLLQDLLPVLSLIHEANLIHGNLKPENIILRLNSDLVTHSYVLLDLEIPQVGLPHPNLAYAPIEQVRGSGFPASDLYSLGVCCARLLTGCFPEANEGDELYDGMEGTWLWRWLPGGKDVSPQLVEVLQGLLVETVKNRYQSAKQLLATIQTYQQQTEVLVGSTDQDSVEQRSPLPIVYPAIATNPNFPLDECSFRVVKVGHQGQQIDTTQHSAKFFTENLGEGINLDMVYIPGGTYQMGSPATEAGRFDSESPQHQVTVSPFFLGKFAVTQRQWEKIMQAKPSHFRGPDRPVEQVSWHEAVEFCQRLSQKTKKNYRLPTEAEWEYAAKAATTTPFCYGETLTTDLANYDGTQIYGSGSKGIYRRQTINVGNFPPNQFGLYEMHGNVWEWCADPWHENYEGAPTDSSIWSASSEEQYKVLRGGSCGNHPRFCRSSERGKGLADYWYYVIGFRVACS
ncbi:bifunctional serine/threonine-protein kinase/formylglycine-generating enzyme family protein [Merismopedia glauca]|uniref:Serine/threonine protein kinase n=1 Tax=Merismopedia glauca CCAP 1448/3 TaxID=1296344 RepID=A0A2T1BWW4_9CYAN|nr:bifunctional serine/threonine-protein kinase/formylglycine-generating enzyme family protein [Merismopedia glauca]PSB00491.1 serine/threonine protein kinase [Merismopedia glauca CCAP 1448/3]